MGGGVSTMVIDGQAEEMMAYAMLISRTMQMAAFPGIYSLKDFDVLQAQAGGAQPRQGPFVFMTGCPTEPLGAQAQDEDEPPGLLEMEGKFPVRVGKEVVWLGDVTEQNEDGWTPLHACCHSSSTAQAGLAVLKEYRHRGGDINLKTRRGPGGGNSGWTPLHMACAYGIESLAEALVQAGADVNCENSFTWTPLLETCHRGFAFIARLLIKAGADIRHMPQEEACAEAHFLRGPAQSPLGEAARGGFVEICKMLMDAGADKDQANSMGWSPLHEACYYNHPDIVQMLLVHGADATKKNEQGAMPYHLTSLPSIRATIKEVAGPKAAKELPVPVFTIGVDESGQMFIGVQPGQPEEDEESQPGEEVKKIENGADKPRPSKGPASCSGSPSRRAASPPGGGEHNELLHSGQMLGDLPALGRPQHKMEDGEEAGGAPHGHHHHHHHHHKKKRQVPSVAESKAPGMPADIPQEFVCQLSQRPMKDPVRTPYGNVYDRSMITLWLSKQGSICPLTGRPLVESELKPDQGLKDSIQDWLHPKPKVEEADAGAGGGIEAKGTQGGSTGSATGTNSQPMVSEDDLYEF